jgi:acyl carrier protein
MSDSPVFPALAKVIADYFRVDPASIHEQTTAMDVNGWDSMSHILLLIRIEESFQIKLDEESAFAAGDVAELAQLIEQAQQGTNA